MSVFDNRAEQIEYVDRCTCMPIIAIPRPVHTLGEQQRWSECPRDLHAGASSMRKHGVL